MKKLILSSMLLAGFAAQANQDSTAASSLEFSREEAMVEPRGVLLPFIGLGGGYTDSDLNSSVEGTPATIKLLGSFYLESPWVFDVGYGANNQQFTEDAAPQTAMTEGALELAARYRFESRWQLGVAANHLFEQGAYYGAEQADAQFVGLQLLREFNMSPAWLARVGVRAQNLTNNISDTVNMYMVDLQFGWNPVAYKTSVRSTASEEMTQEEILSENERIEPARPVAMDNRPASALQDINYSMISGAAAIQFQPSRFSVATADQQKLRRMAQVLNENSELYDRVEVRGYADSSGNQTANQRLSQQRAEQVKSILQRNGLRDADVVAVGRGADDSSGVSAEDRRAELIFIGVKDEAALRDALSTIE